MFPLCNRRASLASTSETVPTVFTGPSRPSCVAKVWTLAMVASQFWRNQSTGFISLHWRSAAWTSSAVYLNCSASWKKIITLKKSSGLDKKGLLKSINQMTSYLPHKNRLLCFNHLNENVCQFRFFKLLLFIHLVAR